MLCSHPIDSSSSPTDAKSKCRLPNANPNPTTKLHIDHGPPRLAPSRAKGKSGPLLLLDSFLSVQALLSKRRALFSPWPVVRLHG